MDGEKKTRARKPLSVMLTAEERAAVEAAAGAEAVGIGANAKDHTVAAWARRALLAAAERVRSEGR